MSELDEIAKALGANEVLNMAELSGKYLARGQKISELEIAITKSRAEGARWREALDKIINQPDVTSSGNWEDTCVDMLGIAQAALSADGEEGKI